MVKHGLNPHNGFKVSELVLGGLYECRISGRLVLIVNDDPHRGKNVNVGKVHNSTTGQYENFVPSDYQLKYPSK